MKMLNYKTECPSCKARINFPVIGEVEMKKLEDDYIMDERSAQQRLNELYLWLANVSIWGLLYLWITKRWQKWGKK